MAPRGCAPHSTRSSGARRQRCLIHRARNCIGKVSQIDQGAVRRGYWAIFDFDASFTRGEAAVAEARRRAETFASTWGRAYPGAVACVTGHFGLLAAHLHHPCATGAGSATPTSSVAPSARPDGA